jgi:hypothetical protein
VAALRHREPGLRGVLQGTAAWFGSCSASYYGRVIWCVSRSLWQSDGGGSLVLLGGSWFAFHVAMICRCCPFKLLVC